MTISVPHIEHSCSTAVHELQENEAYEFMVMTRSRLDLELFSQIVVARTKRRHFLFKTDLVNERMDELKMIEFNG